METKPHTKIEETNILLQKDYIVTEIQRWGNASFIKPSMVSLLLKDILSTPMPTSLSCSFNIIYICSHISPFLCPYLSLRIHVACDALQFIFSPHEANPRHPLVSFLFLNTCIFFLRVFPPSL